MSNNTKRVLPRSLSPQSLWRKPSVHRPGKKRIENRGSRAAACIEHAWHLLQGQISGLPDVVIVIGQGLVNARGHFRPCIWRYIPHQKAHEIAISPRNFGTPAETLCTLVHEASHALLFTSNPSCIKHFGGCSRDGYYHRREFRDMCKSLGLDCDFHNRRYGWTMTWWADGHVAERYTPILDFLKANLPFGTERQAHFQVQVQPLPESGHSKLCCQCKPPRSVYASKSALAQGGILCASCQGEFTERRKHGPGSSRKADLDASAVAYA